MVLLGVFNTLRFELLKFQNSDMDFSTSKNNWKAN
jgi:hypothetical protein